MLTIVDYGVGNLRSVYMAFSRLGCEAHIATTAGEIRQSSALVLPGVGAFGDAMGNLRALAMVDDLCAALRSGVPFLGICLGLQLLFEVSEELGEHRGLGVLAGKVRRFSPGLKVPQMGWNQIKQVQPSPLWKEIADQSYAYFVHSYYVAPEDPSVIIGSTDYDGFYTSAIARDNMYAIQFHPEKSQDVGESILRNFLRLTQ